MFRQGDRFQSLYALRSGCVKTYTLSDSGEEQITGFYMPGELIGLSGIDSQAYPVSAIAIETTSICEIPYSHFDKLMDEIPGLKRQLIHSLSKEIREDLHMKLLLSQKNADERVANFLLDLSTRIKRRGYAADFIYLAMSRNEIANYLGLAVETVSRVFTRLQKNGLLTVNGRSVEIHSPEELTRVSGQCIFSDIKQ